MTQRLRSFGLADFSILLRFEVHRFLGLAVVFAGCFPLFFGWFSLSLWTYGFYGPYGLNGLNGLNGQYGVYGRRRGAQITIFLIERTCILVCEHRAHVFLVSRVLRCSFSGQGLFDSLALFYVPFQSRARKKK